MRRFIRAFACAAFVAAACNPDLGGFSGGAASDAGGGSPPPPPQTPPPPGDDAGGDAGADADADANLVCTLPTSSQTAHVIYDAPDAGPTSSLGLTLGNAQSAGDFLVVGVNYDSSGCLSVKSITDTAGDKFTAIVAPDSAVGALTLETWGASNIAAAAAGDNRITITFAGSCTAQNMKVTEYTGVDPSAPVDAFVSKNGALSASPTATIATMHPATLFAHSADDKSATGPGVGWKLLVLDAWATLAMERTAEAPGMHVVDYTSNAAENFVVQAVALRATCR